MGDQLEHRGPDQRKEQTFSWEGAHGFLGFTRLAILDLETGQQPIAEVFWGDEVKRQGVLDPEMAASLFRGVDPGGVEPHTLVSGADQAFSVLMFTLWYRELME